MVGYEAHENFGKRNYKFPYIGELVRKLWIMSHEQFERTNSN